MAKFTVRTHVITNYEIEARDADSAAATFEDMSTHANLSSYTTDAWIDKVVRADAAVWPHWGEECADERTPEPIPDNSGVER